MNCVAYGCKSRYRKKQGQEISFHRFPADEKLRALWIKAVSRKDFTPKFSSRICSLHFEEECFRQGKIKHYLYSNAVPSIFPAYPSYLQKKLPMPRKYIPKYGSYKKNDEELMEKAIEETDENFLSVVSDKYGISRSVLARQKSRVEKSSRGQRALTAEQENAIVHRINKCLKRYSFLTKIDMRNIVKAYLDRRGLIVKKFKDNRPGLDFIKCFLNRHRDRLPESLFRKRRRPIYHTVDGKFTNKDRAHQIKWVKTEDSIETLDDGEENTADEEDYVPAWRKILDSLENQYEDSEDDSETVMYILVVANKKKGGNYRVDSQTVCDSEVRNNTTPRVRGVRNQTAPGVEVRDKISPEIISVVSNHSIPRTNSGVRKKTASEVNRVRNQTEPGVSSRVRDHISPEIISVVSNHSIPRTNSGVRKKTASEVNRVRNQTDPGVSSRVRDHISPEIISVVRTPTSPEIISVVSNHSPPRVNSGVRNYTAPRVSEVRNQTTEVYTGVRNDIFREVNSRVRDPNSPPRHVIRNFKVTAR